MATLKTYARQLWSVQRSVAEKFGIQLAGATADQRAIVLSGDVTLAMLLKILTDKGVITDAELLAVANQVKAATFPQLPGEVVGNSDEPLPDPDMGT